MIDVTGKTMDVVLAANIFEHVMSVKMAQRPASVGIVANQLRDFDSVREFFTSGSVVSATDLLFAVLFIAVLFIIAGPLAWIPLVMLPIMIALGLIMQRPLDRAMKRLQAESAARHGVLVESLSGLETVRATGAEARMQTAWERSVAATARSGEDVHFWSSLTLTSASAAQQITSLLLVIIGVFLILDGKLSRRRAGRREHAGRPRSGSDRRHRVDHHARDADIVVAQVDRPHHVAGARAVAAARLCREKDRARAVSLSRTSASAIPTRRAKRSRRFRSRSRPASGSASSDASVRARRRSAACCSVSTKPRKDASWSTASIRGNMIRRICAPASALRCRTPTCSSESCATILRSGKPEATDEEVLAAARLSGVESFIAGHPMGYDMPISEGGRSLSGGQKQAIGLARVLIRKPRVLFLDEPTAHFDVRSEAEFLERLKAICAASR